MYPFNRDIQITRETALWMLLGLAAALTRFWDLEYRTLHHDEAIHTFLSWTFATGEQPYEHHPLSHGPFLFHANALIYLLFGVSDATSRILPALTGVLLVLAPWLLRGERHLGRWGALAAGTFLLLSPSFLYYTRFIRHDPYTVLGALLLCIAIFLYLERPERRWMIIAFLSVALMITNHEISFAVLLVFLLFLWGALLFGPLRVLIPAHLVGAVVGVALLIFSQRQDWTSLPEIPWQGAALAEVQRFYWEVLTNPLVLSLIALAGVFVLACILTLRWASNGTPSRLLDEKPPHTVGYGVRTALKDRGGLVIGATVLIALYFAFFTTLFTNLHGIATGTYAPDGTVLYWLGQHDVRRGAQPWFYYITLTLQYEWVMILLGGAGFVLTVVRSVKSFVTTGNPALLFTNFLAFWGVSLFLILSWAGEKMPWLTLHFALPLLLLGARAVNDVITRLAVYRSSHSHAVGFVTFLIVLGLGWLFALAQFTYPEWIEVSPGQYAMEIAPEARSLWWTLSLFPIAGVVAGIAVSRWLGVRLTLWSAFCGVIALAMLFQVHTGFRLAYLDGDGAQDTMIYNTISPDVKRVSADAEQLSLATLGTLDMEIAYDACTQWPMNWYLRDMPNRRMLSNIDPEQTQQLPPILIGVPEEFDADCGFPDEIPGYTSYVIFFRWHELESAVYRNFAIAPEFPPFRSAWGHEDNPHDLPAIARSIASSLQTITTPEGQQRIFRLLAFREMPAGVNSYDAKVYIADDILPWYLDIRYRP